MRALVLAMLLASGCEISCESHQGQPDQGARSRRRRSGQISSEYGNVSVAHDDVRDVTCWFTYNGISCLPDHSFMPADAGTNEDR